MDEDADPAEKINELLGAVAALKAYIAHFPVLPMLTWTL